MKKDARSILFWVLAALLFCTLIPLLLCLTVFPRWDVPALSALLQPVLPYLPWAMLAELSVGAVVWRVLSVHGERKAILSVLRKAQIYLAGGTAERADESSPGMAAELAKAHNRLLDRLEAADATRADFMSNVSHDLKTPMTVIQGYATNILNGAVPRQDEPRYLTQIIREIKRLSGLIGIYQEVSRIDAGDWAFSIRPFDFAEKLQETVGIFLDRMESKNLGGDFDCPPGPLTVLGDAEAIGRVLYCLFDNAVKFTPENGKVDVSVAADAQGLVFSIYNEGKGISGEDLPYIFDRSFKADRSRGAEKDSFGFGLYLCKRILEYHSAEITAESEENRYCRFSFSLPRATDEMK